MKCKYSGMCIKRRPSCIWICNWNIVLSQEFVIHQSGNINVAHKHINSLFTQYKSKTNPQLSVYYCKKKTLHIYYIVLYVHLNSNIFKHSELSRYIHWFFSWRDRFLNSKRMCYSEHQPKTFLILFCRISETLFYYLLTVLYNFFQNIFSNQAKCLTPSIPIKLNSPLFCYMLVYCYIKRLHLNLSHNFFPSRCLLWKHSLIFTFRTFFEPHFQNLEKSCWLYRFF